MQKLKLVAVGGLKEKYWKDAVEEYKKRLLRFCDLEIVEVAEKSNLPFETKSSRNFPTAFYLRQHQLF